MAAEPSHADLCILSRLWNKKHNSPFGCDARVKDWLDKQIERARQREDEPAQAAVKAFDKLAKYNSRDYPL